MDKVGGMGGMVRILPCILLAYAMPCNDFIGEIDRLSYYFTDYHTITGSYHTIFKKVLRLYDRQANNPTLQSGIIRLTQHNIHYVHQLLPNNPIKSVGRVFGGLTGREKARTGLKVGVF